MKKTLLLLFFFGVYAQAQEKPTIVAQEVVRVETELASDKMEGRAIFTPGNQKASAFIEAEVEKIGLQHFKGLENFRQEFTVKGKAANNVIGIIPGKSRPDEYVVFSAHYDHLEPKKKRR